MLWHIYCGWGFTVSGKWRRYYRSKTKLIAADKQNWERKKKVQLQMLVLSVTPALQTAPWIYQYTAQLQIFQNYGQAIYSNSHKPPSEKHQWAEETRLKYSHTPIHTHPQITTYKGAFQCSASNVLISFYRHPDMNGFFYLVETSHIYVSAAKHNNSRMGEWFWVGVDGVSFKFYCLMTESSQPEHC